MTRGTADARRPGPLQFLRALVRWDEWYESKMPLFLVCMYYGALRQPSPREELGTMAALFLVLCAYASFGHIVNDVSDVAADRAAGKRRALATLGAPARAAATVVPPAAAIAAAAVFFGLSVAVLVGLACVLGAIYSLRPVRLKERGFLGWIAATVAQRTMPAVIIFQVFGVWDWTALALVLLSTLTALCYIGAHQLDDLQCDLQAGVRTAATEYGVARLRWTLRRVLGPAQFASFWVAVAVMSSHVPAVAYLAVAYAVYHAASWWVAARRRRTRASIAIRLFGFTDQYCMTYWPLVLAWALGVRDPRLFVLLPLTAVLLLRNVKEEVRGAMRLWHAATGSAVAM